MASVALIKYYATLIKKQMMSMEQIEPEFQEAVQKAINGEIISHDDQTTDNASNLTEDIPSGKIGAITLDDYYILLKNENINVDGARRFSVFAPIKMDDIFSSEVLNENPFPEAIDLRILYIENVYNRFSSDAGVEIIPDGDDWSIHVVASDMVKNNTDVVKEYLRVDLLIKSSNYEDMRLSVYLSC